MSSRTLDELTGCKIRGSVGEPWDFRSDAGRGAIEGAVSAASTDESNQWVLCEVLPFTHDGREVTTLLAVERYGRGDPLSGLAYGRRVGVNLVFRGTGDAITPDQVDEILRTGKDFPFLAGGIQLVDPPGPDPTLGSSNMTVQDLAAKLAADGFNPRAYTLDGTFPAYTGFSLGQKGGHWQVAYCDRGIRREEYSGDSESAACERMYELMDRYFREPSNPES